MNLGKSKSDSELDIMANSIKSFDIIAVQEVVAGTGGALAVSRLVSILNRKGTKWEYVISNPTTSTNHPPPFPRREARREYPPLHPHFYPERKHDCQPDVIVGKMTLY